MCEYDRSCLRFRHNNWYQRILVVTFYEWFTILIILKNNIRVDLFYHNPPPFGASVLVGTERFSYPYKECLVPLSNRCEISQSTSLVRRGFHKKCLVPISNRCGISQSTLMVQRDFYTLIRNVPFSAPTDVVSHNSHLLGAQHPRWHTARCVTLIPFVTAQTHN